MEQKHQRKPNRLPKYDYSQDGYYFVTICTWEMLEYFGQIKNNQIILNQFGLIVQKQWLWLAEQYPYVQLDKFVIMPNHFHGIIIINDDNVRNGRDRSVCDNQNRALRKIKSLSELIGAFKTTSSKLIHNTGLSIFRWHKSFYDHIIRDEKDLNRARQYIIENPAKWALDRNHPDNL